VAPLPWRHEGALPHPALGASRRILRIRVGATGIARPVERQALSNEPTREVAIALVAGRDEASEPVTRAWHAAYRRRAQPLPQAAEAQAPPAIDRAIGGPATLPPLGRIDAEHADRRAGDFEGIAVDHMRAAADRAGRGRRLCEASCGDDALGARQPHAVRHR